MDTAKSEAIKEGARYVLFLIVSWLITGAIGYFSSVPETELTMILVVLLRVLDKYLYKSGFEGGISRF